ncbi:hypothetical protein FGG08_004911 [Glutinoglossum americanum]|uniref:Mannose-1-phosphate guanyltransferase n=1 Tax=Glutinoglossum americanum TaxID=1670608 RepID=A0A9P8I8A8_9PEZI|nr:hypothetical protein FGG08_004911 [Glutinoglossum americanum]
MSRKPQKSNISTGKKGGEDEREDSLQAVILADSYETRFNPFTLERPRCLLPLANTPMIEYTFDFLANAGVRDIFVYCGAHTSLVVEYIRKSKWSLPSSPFKSLEIIKSTSRSVGDAMRDLDSRHLITGDFVVVSADVVSNIPLEGALAKHRARRAADKNAIMTMVLRETDSAPQRKPQRSAPSFVIDPLNDRCLQYQDTQQDTNPIDVDPDLMLSHAGAEIRNDLVDCYIDICTPDVLALWTDSFDYESPRKHFLYGVLKDYELNGKTIHTHIVGDHYAGRVRSLQAYRVVNRDIVQRWAYPLCPDSNLLVGQSYRHGRDNIYKEENVVLSRSCIIGPETVIGDDTSIAGGSTIRNSVVGRRCQIGKNVSIDGSHIWDDTIIGDGSEVRGAIVASGVIVGRNCNIKPGALVSYGVRLAEEVSVSGNSRITRSQRKHESDEESKAVSSDAAIVGEGGEGYEFKESDAEDDDEPKTIPSPSHLYSLPNLALSSSSVSTFSSDVSSEHIHHSKSGSFATIVSKDGQDDGDFHHDAASSVFDSFQRGDASDVVQLELMGLRMSSNANYHQVRRAVVAAFMKRIQQLVDTQSKGTSEAVSEVLKKYQELVKRMIFDYEKEAKDDQVDLLLLVQRDAVNREKGGSILLFTAKELYELDVVEEEGILQWWGDERAGEGELERVKGQVRQFVEWLENAEEDGESDESE